MNAKRKNEVAGGTKPDLQLAFDVGHSSLGWAVLQTGEANSFEVSLLGCGVVTFGADDCLASQRRAYRRQRRHSRSTRQRIVRMEKLLLYLKLIEPQQLATKHQQAGGHPAPWLLAARILASNGDPRYLLDWPELWDVIRWYAHNRGYDGNARWANACDRALSDAEQEEKKADTEKEKKADELMENYGKKTMAETVFADLFAPFHLNDPTKVSSLPFFQRRFKANQCAFSRETVEAEVARLLDAHTGNLKGCNKQFIRLLLTRKLMGEDRGMLSEAGIRLPKRFEGGLLFGQLVPRFDNRIIAACPVTGEKVPNKHCLEFLEFRWAMTLANIGVGFGTETYRNREGNESTLRPLTGDERRKVDARARRLGFLKAEPDRPGKDGLVRSGRNELREIVVAATNCDRHNLDTLLLHPDAREGLRLLRVKGDTTAFRVAWGSFGDPLDIQGHYHDDPLRHRFTTQLLRLKKLNLRSILSELERLGKVEVALCLRAAAELQAKGKKVKLDPIKLDGLLDAEFSCDKLKGRARYSRAKLAQAVQEVFNKSEPIHPLQKGGCLEQTNEIKQAALDKPMDQQTNNHLVRHRLLILKRLQEHLFNDYADGDKLRVSRITVEVARDVQTTSGMTNKEKAKELGSKIKHHHETAAWLAERLEDERDENGRRFVIGPSLIRKARIADDLGWECPYTGRKFEPADLIHRRYDKDHIVPRSKRLSDALEAMVITSCEVNREKKNRTALQFIKDMNLPENRAVRERLNIRTEAQFREFVDELKAKGSHADDVRRRKRRKELLLVQKYEEKEFTPADLTKTRFINKLAAQQLQAAFRDLPEQQRPPIIAVPGAVTSAFRDRTWKLLPLLGAANGEVNKLHEAKQKANAEGKDFNLKDAIRNVTHLHHALDAISVGLITALLVPPGQAARAGLNGELARLIHKGKLTDDERRQFDALAHQFRLPRFYRWGEANRLDLEELDERVLNQIRERLAEKRVVQHIPADMSGLKVEENTRGIEKLDSDRVYLHQRKRDEKTGKLTSNPTDESIGKALGLQPDGGKGKLKDIHGVRVISENFGVALLDRATAQEEKFVIIPHHKVWHRIEELKPRNAGKAPRVLRNGQVVQIDSGTYKGRWRVFSIKNKKAGLKVNLGTLDCLEVEYQTADPETGKKVSRTTPGCKLDAALETMIKGGLKVLSMSLSGQVPCPTTSSA